MSDIIYDLVLGYAADAPAIVWINKPKLIDGRFPRGPHPHPLGLWSGEGSGFPVGMEEPPTFVIDPRVGRLPLNDCEALGGTFWLVSGRTKEILEHLDREAFVFCRAKIQRADDKPYEGESYWLCDIIRFLDALDEEQSDVKPRTVGGTKWTDFPIGRDAIFNSRVVNNHHVFRLMYNPRFVGCDQDLRSAVENAHLTGFWFYRRGLLDG